MKVRHLLVIFELFVLYNCYGQNDITQREKYVDNKIHVNGNNIPIDSNELYFPLAFFPKFNFVSEYEDSSTVLVSKVIGFLEENDTLRTFSKKNPNQFDTSTVLQYSSHLFSFKEPLLYNEINEKEIFRFTWLRSFDNPITIRIEKDKETYYIFWKETKRISGNGTKMLITNKKKRIRKSQWNRFQSLLNTVDFWDLSNQANFTGLDGSHWILEGATPGKYNVVDKWSPHEEDNFYIACNYLIKLSGIRVSKSEKY